MRPMRLGALAWLAVTAGCSAGSGGARETTPEPGPAEPATGEAAAPAGDATLPGAVAAAGSFAESLGPVLAAPPEVRAFEACDRADELLIRATELRDAGVPASVARPEAYEDEVSRLPAAVTVLRTGCGRGPESLTEGFEVPVELGFYRVLLQLEPSMPAAAGAESAVEAARAVRDVLAPVVEAHRDARADALCDRATALVEAVEGLAGEAPTELAAGRRYGDELARLAEAAGAAATACEGGAASLPAAAPTTVEVTADRLWLMLHGRWPGAATGG